MKLRRRKDDSEIATKGSTGKTEEKFQPKTTATPQEPGSESQGAVTLRIPRRALQVIGLVVVVGLVGAGVWYTAIRDTGPTDEEVAAQEAADERAAAQAAAAQEAADCQAQAGGLLTALNDLESRLNGLGLNYEQYLSTVGNVSAAYGAMSTGQMSPGCLNVAVQAENAMNAFIDSGNTWSDCFDDINCDIDSIDSELQLDWAKATVHIEKAEMQLTELGTP